MPVPVEPVLFSKAPSCVCGPDDDVIIPKGSKKLDWEVELAFVIGKRASYVSEADALGHVLGYMICNDVSERFWQLEGTGQWIKGKSAETFGPLGPWLVTADEVGDPQNLDMWLDVNGQRMQTGNTSTMIFGVADAGLLPLGQDGARAGRRGDDRDAAGRRTGQEAEADFPEGRRRDGARSRSSASRSRAWSLTAGEPASYTGGRGIASRSRCRCRPSGARER